MLLDGRPLQDNALDARLYLERGRLHERLRRAVSSRYNTLLLGKRGSGKTTELAQLAFRLREDDVPVAFADVGLAESPLAVVQLIRNELGRTPSISDSWRQAFRTALEPQPPALSVDSQLLDAVRALNIEDPDGDDSGAAGPICLIVDGLASTEIAYTLFGRLRDELWRLPYVWVISGDVKQESSFLAPPADAFFDVVLRIPDLELQDAQDLIARRASADVTESPGQRFLPDVTGLIGAWADTPREVLRMFREADLEDRTLDEVARDQQKLEDKARALGPSSEMAYREMRAMNRPVSASDAEFLNHLGWTRPRAVKVLNELEAAGLARASTAPPDGSGGRPRKLYLPVLEVFK
jgi:hypothetical protein